MRLFMFEHCSLCFRIRMMAALKGQHLQETIVLADDAKTLTDLVGRRVTPILIKDDGEPMLESLDIVDYIHAQGQQLLTGVERDEVASCAQDIVKTSPLLTIPRYPLLNLPEFATIAARDHFVMRKFEVFGDFAALRARTRELVDELMPKLERLDGLIQSPAAINGELSRDDIRILPLLRSAAVVEGLQFPSRTREYFEFMMTRIGHKPLPKI